MVTLRFAHIRKGHAGVYTCVVQDKDGNKFTYDIPVEVLDAVGELVLHVMENAMERVRCVCQFVWLNSKEREREKECQSWSEEECVMIERGEGIE